MNNTVKFKKNFLEKSNSILNFEIKNVNKSKCNIVSNNYKKINNQNSFCLKFDKKNIFRDLHNKDGLSIVQSIKQKNIIMKDCIDNLYNSNYYQINKKNKKFPESYKDNNKGFITNNIFNINSFKKSLLISKSSMPVKKISISNSKLSCDSIFDNNTRLKNVTVFNYKSDNNIFNNMRFNYTKNYSCEDIDLNKSNYYCPYCIHCNPIKDKTMNNQYNNFKNIDYIYQINSILKKYFKIVVSNKELLKIITNKNINNQEENSFNKKSTKVIKTNSKNNKNGNLDSNIFDTFMNDILLNKDNILLEKKNITKLLLVYFEGLINNKVNVKDVLPKNINSLIENEESYKVDNLNDLSAYEFSKTFKNKINKDDYNLKVSSNNLIKSKSYDVFHLYEKLKKNNHFIELVYCENKVIYDKYNLKDIKLDTEEIMNKLSKLNKINIKKTKSNIFITNIKNNKISKNNTTTNNINNRGDKNINRNILSSNNTIKNYNNLLISKSFSNLKSKLSNIIFKEGIYIVY